MRDIHNLSDGVDPMLFAAGGIASDVPVETRTGPVPARDLRIGMLVWTLDHGFRPLRAVRRAVVTQGWIDLAGHFDRAALRVCPDQLLCGERAACAGHGRVLATAGDLAGQMPQIATHPLDAPDVCIRLMFSQLEILRVGAFRLVSSSLHSGRCREAGQAGEDRCVPVSPKARDDAQYLSPLACPILTREELARLGDDAVAFLDRTGAEPEPRLPCAQPRPGAWPIKPIPHRAEPGMSPVGGMHDAS